MVLAAPLAAQDHRVQIAGYAGAMAPLSELGQVAYPITGGTAVRRFSGGVSFGANATFWLDDNLGLRADGSFAGYKVTEPRVGCLPECTTAWTKLFFGGDIMLRRPTEMGLAPYAYFGAGVAKMSESGSVRKASRPHARVGAGLNYTPAKGALGFFGELGLIVYDFDQTKFTFYDRVQTDLALRAGVSFAF
ncbi:MAG: hypothetical protein EXR93_01365 [Gemmatimonadetes bacterium]|nr:hypothetical protein [Gemmatimonadota bacterium]